MSAGAVFITLIVASFPTLILIALVVKLIEVHRAKSWPMTEGIVRISTVSKIDPKSKEAFGKSTLNEPLVEYEYQVNGKAIRGRRITIGEKTSEYELGEILKRYPVGAKVIVYYDPVEPKKAVLERDLPMGKMLVGLGCLMLFFVGGPAIAALAYFSGVDRLKHQMDPKRAPFVAASLGFAVMVTVFAFAFTRMTLQTRFWPKAKGKIISSGVRTVRSMDDDRLEYQASVLYSYKVNGLEYQGDQIAMGVTVGSNITGIANRTTQKYPVGRLVAVSYDPKVPSRSTLKPGSLWFMLIWIVAIAMFALGWAVATGRM